MSPHATFHTRSGRNVTVSNAAAPHYHSPGVVWHCDGCGECSDWPLNNPDIDNVQLTAAAARAHANLCPH